METLVYNYADEQNKEVLKTGEIVVEPKVVNDTTNVSANDEEESDPEQNAIGDSDKGKVRQPQSAPTTAV